MQTIKFNVECQGSVMWRGLLSETEDIGAEQYRHHLSKKTPYKIRLREDTHIAHTYSTYKPVL